LEAKQEKLAGRRRTSETPSIAQESGRIKREDNKDKMS